ncbi:uncharacterized protein BP5553_06275 [Venustampulla echinocandica]|uniref:Uncharacterized protein n=1 Tax=Venustampulla echinocandica TaxID=2656787 RepID=A0A370TN09_9HELO|nr:uncharacterized protein BP5553_06275 [Venustampulla echinocandica]RDL36923.1 hypothetical protein BP5553_06275 [Venustampulla echinocandica]
MANSSAPLSSGWAPINQPKVFPVSSPSLRSRSAQSSPLVGSAAASSIKSCSHGSSIVHPTDTSVAFSDDAYDNHISSSRASSLEPLSESGAEPPTTSDIEPSVDPISQYASGSSPSPSPQSLSEIEISDCFPEAHIIQFCLFLVHNKCIRVQQHIPEFNALLTKLGYDDPEIPRQVRDKLRVLARGRILQLGQKMEASGALRVTNRRRLKRKRVGEDGEESNKGGAKKKASDESGEEGSPIGVNRMDSEEDEEETNYRRATRKCCRVDEAVGAETVEFSKWTEDWDPRGWDGDLRCPWGWEGLVQYHGQERSEDEEIGGQVRREVFVVEEGEVEVNVLD